jgi:hypothetical protein
MKSFKIADCWISALLIIGFLTASLIRLDFTFIVGYFVVGAWQLISMFVHFFNSAFTNEGGWRYRYHRLIVLIALLLLLFLLLAYLAEELVPLLMITLFILLICSPFMAIYYTWLCYHETFVKMKRPLSLLK